MFDLSQTGRCHGVTNSVNTYLTYNGKALDLEEIMVCGSFIVVLADDMSPVKTRSYSLHGILGVQAMVLSTNKQ